MEYIYFGSGILLIVLIYFLYSIWKEDNGKEKIDLGKKENVDNIINSISNTNINEDNFKYGLSKIEINNGSFQKIKEEINKSIIGMDNFVNSILICLLANGHLLVEGLPGLAKTKTISTLAKIIDLKFKRIQFTPDMLPSDIIGVEIFNGNTKDFEIKKGPVFSNILLADEINRTTPKVQSALLEAMEERQVTIGLQTYKLDEPFLVLATQNPIEQEGTYSLPEAQIDRFMMKTIVNYPELYEEKKILDKLEQNTIIQKLISSDFLINCQNQIEKIVISDQIKDYITRLVQATRKEKNNILYGASPRASISLMKAGKALAFLQGRDYVNHEDIQMLALNILRHRIILTYDAMLDGNDIDSILIEIFKKITLE